MKKLLIGLCALTFFFGLFLLITRGVGIRKISTPEAFNLSAKELSDLKGRTESQGDTNAAFRVYQYYLLSCISCDEADRKSNTLHYATFAATRGNATAAYNLAVYLLQEHDSSKYEEAKFWLKKAADAGDGNARNGLEDWDRFVKQW